MEVGNSYTKVLKLFYYKYVAISHKRDHFIGWMKS